MRDGPVSFEADVRPLFRAKDVNSMISFGGFDLSLYSDVKTNAQSIYERLLDGSMPCDSPWPEDHVELFKAWIDGGMAP